VLLVISTIFLPAKFIKADDYDYVKEVLEDDESHSYGEDYMYTDDYYEQQRLQQEEAERQRQSEEERLAREKVDRIAAEREKDFQAELARMSEEQRKAAIQLKKKDSRVVRSVLKAAKKNNLYAVLGIRNWNLQIPSRDIKIANFKFTIPGIVFNLTSLKAIKKAYRKRAMAVHPDKNRDGHAQEAFIAVENAASILSDKRLRDKYDEEKKLSRLERREESKDLVFNGLAKVMSALRMIFQAIRIVLGPFTTPVLIILAVLI